MNLSLKGKTAVVTGAAKGIGRSIAEKMAESGAAVGIIDFDKATGFAAQEEFTAKGYKCVFAAADVSNYESLVQAKQQLVDAFGKIDILVINAGVGTPFGVFAISSSDRTSFVHKNSASSVGVRYSFPEIPAWEIFGISHVFVTLHPSKNVAFLPLRNSKKSTFPNIVSKFIKSLL